MLLCAAAATLSYTAIQAEPLVENGTITVVMCPTCEQFLLNTLAERKDVRCAMYDIGADAAHHFTEAGAKVIVDDESKAHYGEPHRAPGLMHHKFCVLGKQAVMSGSYNPTDHGELSRNNLLLIESAQLARNYRAELTSLRYGWRPPVRHKILLSEVLIENYFCPRDSCEEQVLRTLAAANESILFMTYSFTSDAIGRLLVQRRESGMHVEGVCERTQLSKYSECGKLHARTWTGGALLHHKVFIIDERIVITGSYNPTANGNERNNENVLIIHSAAVASAFIQEYNHVTGFA